MTAKDTIRQTLTSSQTVLGIVLDGLSDNDLLIRPVPKANHIAWQLGHLITSECQLLKSIPGFTPPVLPDGFAERHNAAASHQDPPQGYLTKAEYLALYGKVREATLAALDRIPDADLDHTNPGPLAPIAPTTSGLFQLLASHAMMHSGQFSVVRRALGKPNAF